MHLTRACEREVVQTGAISQQKSVMSKVLGENIQHVLKISFHGSFAIDSNTICLAGIFSEAFIQSEAEVGKLFGLFVCKGHVN